MKISKVISVVVFAGLVAAAATAAADSGGNPVPPTVSCKAGTLTVTSSAGWLENPKAPWKWDKATGAPQWNGCTPNRIECLHATSVTYTGSSCSGTVTAFVCSGDTCSPPIKLPVH